MRSTGLIHSCGLRRVRRRVEAERACDDHVLNAGYQSTNYAEHLLDNARNVKAVGSVSRTAVAIARSSRIEERIRTILAENLNRRPLTKLAVVVGYCIMTFFAVQMGAMRVAAAELSLEAVLEGLQSAQTEVSSGELEIIYKRDTVARISQAEARGKSQTVIHEMDERFSELSLEVQNRPRYRTNHEKIYGYLANIYPRYWREKSNSMKSGMLLSSSLTFLQKRKPVSLRTGSPEKMSKNMQLRKRRNFTGPVTNSLSFLMAYTNKCPIVAWSPGCAYL